MGRLIGRKPIEIPAGVTVTINKTDVELVEDSIKVVS